VRFIGDFERLWIACVHRAAIRGAFQFARSELRTRTVLVLETIALRDQIAVLERTELVACASVLWTGCVGSCCRTAGRNGGESVTIVRL
jgi:hypothetical protein